MFCAAKRYCPVSKMCRITPAEKISLLVVTPFTLLVKVSGEIQPGVPQLQKMQSSSSAQTASPQSIIWVLRVLASKTILSSFISLCTMSSSQRDSKFFRMFFMITLISGCSSLAFWLSKKSKILTPLISSMTTQQAFSSSKTPQNSTIFYLLRSLRTSTYFFKLYNFYRLCAKAYFAKTLTANFLPFYNLRTQKTEAEAPLPSFLMTLKCFSKLSWLTYYESFFIHKFAQFGALKQREMLRPSEFQSLIALGCFQVLAISELFLFSNVDIFTLKSIGILFNSSNSTSERGQRTMKPSSILRMYFCQLFSSNLILAQSSVSDFFTGLVKYYDLELVQRRVRDLMKHISNPLSFKLQKAYQIFDQQSITSSEEFQKKTKSPFSCNKQCYIFRAVTETQLSEGSNASKDIIF